MGTTSINFSEQFKNKNILLGITGGIAAYKICTLIGDFKKNGANVKVVCTPNSLNFVTKLTLQNLSQNEIFVEEFNIVLIVYLLNLQNAVQRYNFYFYTIHNPTIV